MRAALHKDLVKPGSLDARWGKAFDRLFETRQAADYLELFEVDETQTAELLELARNLVAEMKRLFAAGIGR